MKTRKTAKLAVNKFSRFVYVSQRRGQTPLSDPTTVITTTVTYSGN